MSLNRLHRKKKISFLSLEGARTHLKPVQVEFPCSWAQTAKKSWVNVDMREDLILPERAEEQFDVNNPYKFQIIDTTSL